MLDCAKKTVKAHGLPGLYRGAMPLVVGSSGKQAARWTAYNWAASGLRDENGKLSVGANILCGVVAGTSEAMFAVTPIETLKSRVIDDRRLGNNRYSGSMDAIRKIVAADGLGGLYRGLVPTIAKQATNQAVRFPVQYYCVQWLSGGDESKARNPLYNGVAGGFAGAVSVLLTMPQDTVKTRMQSESAKQLYTSTFDCAKQIMLKEGPMFFYSGTGPRMVRVSLDVGTCSCRMPPLTPRPPPPPCLLLLRWRSLPSIFFYPAAPHPPSVYFFHFALPGSIAEQPSLSRSCPY
jgi:solute carrier family 25 citrate transporter 1